MSLLSGISDIQIGSGVGWSSVSVSAIPYDNLDIEFQFDQLCQSWRGEYGSASSARAIVNAPSYKRIIFMGSSVLPLIFRDLDRSAEPDYWFAALKEITNADPVSQSDRGNMRAMARSWVKWAKANGYTW